MKGSWVGLIVTWFNQRVDEWGVWAGMEAHTQVRPKSFRLPDISVLRLGPLEQVQTSAPLIVIEVLSPSNTIERDDEQARGLRLPVVAQHLDD